MKTRENARKIEVFRFQIEPGQAQCETRDFVALDVQLNAPYQLEWGEIRAPRQTWMETGSLCVVPANRPFFFRWAQPIDFLQFRLDSAFLRETASEIWPREKCEIAESHGECIPQITHLSHALWAQEKAGNPGGILVAQTLEIALAASVVAHFSGQRAPELAATPRLGARRFAGVCEFIETHLDADLSLDQLARIAGLSAFHFARQFKAETGAAPHQYVLARRLERAKILLQNGEDSLAQIAAACGFCDQSHLARHLKRKLGVTPRQLNPSRHMANDAFQESSAKHAKHR